MINLLEETIECIKESEHKISDIVFIGSSDGKYGCTWKEYEQIANREYDNGFGGQKVASDLIIVFSDGKKMERLEYDGSEWWHFQLPFIIPANYKPINNLFAEIGWDTIEQIDEIFIENHESPKNG